MRAHQINEDGRIVNTVMVDELADGLVDANIGGSIGDSIIGGVLVPLVRQISAAEHNAPILAALEALDIKSVRPLREGDAVRVAAIEQECSVLRAQLRKD